MTLTLPPASIEPSSKASLLCSAVATAEGAASVPGLLTGLLWAISFRLLPASDNLARPSRLMA